MRPPSYWQMEFMGQVFPEIEDFVAVYNLTNGEGFYIGRWFAADREFCKKCYEKLKRLKSV